MTIESRLRMQDFLAAQRLHFRPPPAVRIALYGLGVIVGILFLLEGWAIARAGQLPRGWWILPAGLAYGALLFFIVLPWRVTRIFKQNPALAGPTRITFADDGLMLDSARGQIRFGWPMLKKWKRNRQLILVYHSAMHFHILPRTGFASDDDFQTLAELLRKKLGPELA